MINVHNILNFAHYFSWKKKPHDIPHFSMWSHKKKSMTLPFLNDIKSKSLYNYHIFIFYMERKSIAEIFPIMFNWKKDIIQTCFEKVPTKNLIRSFLIDFDISIVTLTNIKFSWKCLKSDSGPSSLNSLNLRNLDTSYNISILSPPPPHPTPSPWSYSPPQKEMSFDAPAWFIQFLFFSFFL